MVDVLIFFRRQVSWQAANDDKCCAMVQGFDLHLAAFTSRRSL